MSVDGNAKQRAEDDLRESEERYRTIFVTIDEGFIIAELIYDDLGRAIDALYLEGNPAASNLTGGRDYNRQLLSTLVPDAEPYWIETYGRVANTGVPERREEYLAPLDQWYSFQVSRISQRRPGRGARVAIIFQDITDRKRAQEALRTNEERLRDVLNCMAEGFALFAPDFTILDVNEETLRIDGRSRNELVGRSHWEVYPETEHSPLGHFYKQAMRDRMPGSLEFAYNWPDGREMWVEVRLYPNPDGRLACFWRDITERKRADAAQATLLAELQHRVRNILALLRSVIGRTSRSKNDLSDYVDHLQGRVDAMARTQSLLTRSADAAVSLEGIVRDELVAVAASDERYQVSGPEIDLAPKAAEVLTLAIHELATNSVKYGALNNAPEGFIDVQWAIIRRDGKALVQIQWNERGLILDHSPPDRGFGTELITERVPYELNGQGEMVFGSDELRVRIEFPFDRKRSVFETKQPIAARVSL